MTDTDIGAWVRSQRALVNESQAGLSHAMGKSRTWVSSLERGEFRPRAEDCAMLATQFGSTPEQVMRLAGYDDAELAALRPGSEGISRTVVLTAAELAAIVHDAAMSAVREVLAELGAAGRLGAGSGGSGPSVPEPPVSRRSGRPVGARGPRGSVVAQAPGGVQSRNARGASQPSLWATPTTG